MMLPMKKLGRGECFFILLGCKFPVDKLKQSYIYIYIYIYYYLGIPIKHIIVKVSLN